MQISNLKLVMRSGDWPRGRPAGDVKRDEVRHPHGPDVPQQISHDAPRVCLGAQ